MNIASQETGLSISLITSGTHLRWGIDLWRKQGIEGSLGQGSSHRVELRKRSKTFSHLRQACHCQFLLFAGYLAWFSLSVQSLSHVQLIAHQASLSITHPQSLLKFMSIKSVMPSIHLILCHPLLLLPSIFPSIRVFSNESVLRIKVAKILEFQLQHQSFNEYSRPISFRTYWLDLLAVQEILKSLFQHCSPRASIPCCSAVFTVQLS